MHAQLGWTTLDLFGGNVSAARVRLDRAGVVLLLASSEIICASADMLRLRTATGAVQGFYRAAVSIDPRRVPL